MLSEPETDDVITDEQMRRLRAARRLLAPTEVEMATGFARFQTRLHLRPRRAATMILRLGAVAVVLAAVVAAASAAARIASWRRSQAHRVEFGAGGASRQMNAQATNAVATVAVPVAVPVEVAPAALPQQARWTKSWVRPTRHDATGRIAPDRRASGFWRAAADSLRAGDVAGAERAFDRLVSVGDVRTRDAARLARAQLWLSQGRWSEARRELEALARAGTTALVRARAAEALEGSVRSDR